MLRRRSRGVAQQSQHPFSLAQNILLVAAVALGVVDLVAVTLLMRGTGGVNSGFFILYLLTLVFAAAFFPQFIAGYAG